MRCYNFSPGPGALPPSVLDEAARAVHQLPGTNLSILGLSHRDPRFADIVDEAEDHYRALLNAPDDYRIVFLQGGGSLQFSMVPMTFMPGSPHPADYITCGYWSNKAIAEARKEGRVRELWNGNDTGNSRLPDPEDVRFDDAAYLHYVSNETVEGLQFHWMPGRDEVPRICDMSSDFLSRPVDVERYKLIYAHAQKNLGPAGVTVVVLHESVLDEVPAKMPAMLDYRQHVKAHSVYNTAPVFAIYVTMLVARWIRQEVGGLEEMERINRAKATRLYSLIDRYPDFFRAHARSEDRSLMNIAFTLPTKELEDRFVEESERHNLYGLKGHRSIGGLRASLYNAVTLDDVEVLTTFMEEFHEVHSKSVAGVISK